MDKEKPRLSRLTAILTQLQSKRIITARNIAEKHNVSIRTVYRDIGHLKNQEFRFSQKKERAIRLRKDIDFRP